jgi:hypothetical protein
MAGTSVLASQPGAVAAIVVEHRSLAFDKCAKSMAGPGVTVRSFFDATTNTFALTANGSETSNAIMACDWRILSFASGPSVLCGAFANSCNGCSRVVL